MDEVSRPIKPTIVPYFGYRDAAAALRWLAEAFGFEEKQAFSASDGTVMHAEMASGGGVVMIGTGARIVYGPEDTEFGTRRYRALDPEGYGWSFGTYSPSA